MKRPENVGRGRARAILAGLTIFSSSLLGSGPEYHGLESRSSPSSHVSHIGGLAVDGYRSSSYLKKSIDEHISKSNKLKKLEEKIESRSIYLAKLAQSMVTPLEFSQWSKVNQCEEGGNWYVSGPKYSGGLGIANENWVNYGGTEFTPTASTATPDEQIVVAIRIQSDPPDQNGCQPW